MEQRLIDCEKTIEAIRLLAEKHHMNGEIEMANGVLKAITRVEAQPTIDPVHVAGGCRCRECSFYEKGTCTKNLGLFDMNAPVRKPTDFCSCGKRREQNA